MSASNADTYWSLTRTMSYMYRVCKFEPKEPASRKDAMKWLCLQAPCCGYLLSFQKCCNKMGFAGRLLSIQLQQALSRQL